MKELTRKEKGIISEAWHALMYRAQCTSNEHKIEDQFRLERKLRGGSTETARSLILAEVARLYRNPGATVRDVIGISSGILLGAMYGLDSILRTECYDSETYRPCTVKELLSMIDSATEIHQKGITRMVENFGKDKGAECRE